jgi:hypothetical protein
MKTGERPDHCHPSLRAVGLHYQQTLRNVTDSGQQSWPGVGEPRQVGANMTRAAIPAGNANFHMIHYFLHEYTRERQ